MLKYLITYLGTGVAFAALDAIYLTVAGQKVYRPTLDYALADKPALVILELGANDALRGIDPKLVRANLDAMIKKIQASGAKLLLAGMKCPSNWGEHYQHEFERIYPELAQADGVALYPFFLDGVAMQPQLNQPDGLHPNARGVAVIVERIAPTVARLIGGPS